SSVLNPNIDFEATPFVVQQELADWPAPVREVAGIQRVGKRIAGISSFGAGGANAHVVIEEYSAPPTQDTPSGPALIVLSARSEDRLQEQVRQLRDAIEVDAAIHLTDLAYTLQVGREAMEERLGLVVSSVEELKQKLSEHLEGRDVDELYRGQVKRNKEALAALTGDEDTAAMAEAWIAKGKFGKLLDLWVKGMAVDWQRLYGGRRPQRISLPTYPFARERYWVQTSATQPTATTATTASLHPLVHRNTSDVDGLRFSTQLSGEEFFLADHVVRGERVLPGVAQLEMARTAARQVLGHEVVALSGVVWMRPVVVASEGLSLHIALDPEDDGALGFEIYSEDDEGEVRVYSQGRARELVPASAQAHDLQALRALCQQTQLTAAQCYARFEQLGLHYGPAFQGLREVLVGQDRLLARISLPDGAPQDGYQLHPSLLDAALQATLGLQAENAPLSLPFALGALEVLAPCTAEMWAVVRRSAGSSAGDAVQRLDVELCDEHGQVCVRLGQFSLRSVNDGKTLATEQAAHETDLLLAPVWQVVNPPAPANQASTTERVLILGGPPARRQAVLSQFPAAALLALPPAAQIAEIEQGLRQHGEFDHLVWIADSGEPESDQQDDEGLIALQQQGVVLGFRLVKALLALGLDKRPLNWTVLTVRTQAVHLSDAVLPAHAGVHGFVGAAAKEFRRWQFRLLDLDGAQAWPLDQLFQLPFDPQGDALAWRSGQWFRQALLPVDIASAARHETLYRRGGVYVVIGGAGGIGQAWSGHMIRAHQANIVWIGRRPLDEAIAQAQERLAAFGPRPEYIAADATDLQALVRAREQILARHPAIHGVMHAAIALLDKSLAQMDEDRLLAGLAAKVDVSVRMCQVFGALPLDFMLFCSSLLSFMKAAGQSNYAAGCTFKDAYALQLAQRLPYPVKVMNWGYWGSVGVVASQAYRERMAQLGFGSIEAEEGMLAIERLLAAPMPQLGFLKVAPAGAKGGLFDLVGDARVHVDAPRFGSLAHEIASRPASRAFPIDAGRLTQHKREIDRLSLAILRGELQALGWTGEAAVPGLRPGHARWLAHSRQWLAASADETTSLAQAWAAWQQRKTAWLDDADLRAQVQLVDAMLGQLPAILQGRVQATSVMFPGSSMHLVEGVYQGNAVADHFNDVLCDTVVAFVAERVRQDPEARIRILEIGAGTGGTSARVLARLKPFASHMAAYAYTDLSRAFLLHAERKYGPDHPYLDYRLFDVGCPLAGQGVEAGSYDLAIATNVLHATRDIRESLRNAKALLRPNGLLVLNELSRCELWTHLTFGLLDGWWLYEDEALRIPSSPSLAPERWDTVLREEGYRHVLFPAAAQHALGQQVVVAESDGVTVQRQPVRAAASLPAAPARIAPAPAPVPAAVARSRNEAAPGPSTAQVTATSALLREKCVQQFKKLVGQTLKMPLDRIDAGTGLDAYGIDSILVLELSNGLRQAFKDLGIESAVSPTLFFEYASVDSLADHFIATQPEAMMRWVGLDAAAAPQVAASPSLPEPPIRITSQSRRTTARGFRRPGNGTPPATLPPATLDVAIIGLSGRYPEAADVTEFWAHLKAGRNCIREVPAARWDHAPYFDERRGQPGKAYTRWAGFIDDVDCFDPLFFNISPREAEAMSPQERLFIQEAYACIEDAGYTPATLCASRKVGMFVGVMNERYPSGTRFWSIANRVSYLLDFQGPSMAVDTACSSSLTAIHLALESLRSGESEVAIAGGVNLIVDPDHLLTLSAMTMLSAGDKCKSFAADGDGFVDGEAVGALVLKPLQQAVADGDHIHGVIKGSAVNAGGRTNGYMVPNPAMQAQVVRSALERAGVDARNVSYLEAQGTGSSLGDPIEIAGLTKAFRDWTEDKQFCAIGSAKSNVGHCESAAGIVALSKVLMQMKHRTLVPSLHAAEVNPSIDFANSPFALQRELAPWPRMVRDIGGRAQEIPRTAGISSFGAGGANAHVVIEEYIASAVPASMGGAVMVVLSARRQDRLEDQARRLLAAITADQTELSLADLAYTLQVGREAMEERLALTVESLAELRHKLSAFLAGDEAIAGLHRGQARRGKDAMVLLAGDEDIDMASVAATWLAKGKADKLLGLWVRGLPVDWAALHRNSGQAPRRISLPTYPFARERYWTERREEAAASPVRLEHQAFDAPVAAVEPVVAVQPAAVDDATLRQRIQQALVERVSATLKVKPEDIDGETSLSEYGFDSITLTGFGNGLNERYQAELTPTIFFEFPTLDGLAGFLARERRETMRRHFAPQGGPVAAPPAPRATQALSTSQDQRTTVAAAPSRAPAVDEPIAIIGMSGQFPMADDIDALWRVLAEGKDCISEIPRERLDWGTWSADSAEAHARVKWGGFMAGIDEFDPMFFGISPKEAELMDPQQRLMMMQVWKALEDAGYAGSALSGSNTALYVGTMASGYASLISRAHTPVEGHSSTGAVASVGPNRMSYFLDWHGPSEPVETACSSSLVAMRRAVLALQRGDCGMAIAGGVNTLVNPELHASFAKAGMLAEDGRCKTFSSEANGYVRGEGVAMLVLKRLSDAERDGDHIHGLVRGIAENHGGRANSLTAPNPTAQAAVVAKAYERAGIDPRTVTYIEAHGTGTKLGDPVEINGLKAAFKTLYATTGDSAVAAPHCGIGSVKTNIGHLELAAGVTGVIKVLLQMRHRVLVKSLHSEALNPYIDLNGSPFYVVQEAREWTALRDAQGQALPRRAGVSSFGFGGVNAHVVLEEYLPLAVARPAATGPVAVVLSARDDERLREQAERLWAFANAPENAAVDLHDLAYTLQVGREAMKARLGLVAGSLAELREKLARHLAGDTGANEVHRGQAGRNKAATASADTRSGIERSELDTLLALWVKGEAVDWTGMYSDRPPRRISLPSYAFAKERHWVPTGRSDAQATSAPSALLHPLVHRNSSNLLGPRFSSRFSGNEFFLADHVVLDQRILPGAAQLEMARFAVSEAMSGMGDGAGALHLKDVVWARPVTVGPEGVALHVSLYPEDDGDVRYALHAGTAEAEVFYGQGLVTASADQAAPVTHDITALQQQCSQAYLGAAQCYALFDDLGLHYGSGFQGLGELFIGEQLAVAAITLPPSVLAAQDSYVLHPSLLDAAMQASVGLRIGANTGGLSLMLPFALGSLAVLAPCTAAMWAVVRPTADHASSDAVQEVDIDLCDANGMACVQFRRLGLKAMTTSTPPTDSAPKAERSVPAPVPVPVAADALDSFDERAVRYLVRFLANALKLPTQKIDAQAQMESYGIDSILILDLTRSLEKQFGPLPKTLFFEYQTIAALSGYFVQHHPAAMAALVGQARSVPSTVALPVAATAEKPVSALLRHRSRYEVRGPIHGNASASAAGEIAIIGLSGRYPEAGDVGAFWANLSAGKDSISEIPAERWDWRAYFDEDRTRAGKTYSKWGGFIEGVDEFDPLFFNISPREAELMDPQERLFLQCVHATLEDAGYTRGSVAAEQNVGVFVGVMYEEYQLYGAQEQARGHNLAVFNSPASIANRISYWCNFSGPSLALDTMCSSSLTAIHLACQSLRQGNCAVAVAGGVNVSVHPNKYLMLAQGKFISGKGRCESFGEGGEGYVPGEGVGAILLKPLAQAQADGDHIYGVIKASAINHGGKTNGYTVPNPNAQAKVIERALKEGGIDARDISYIEAHGTGTSLGDPIEIAGLAKAFGQWTQDKQYCAIGSAKSNIGHCESAAGIAGVTKVLLQLKHRQIAPSLHSAVLNPNIDFEATPFVVQQALTDWPRPVREIGGTRTEGKRIAGISSFGAGGANAHVVVEEYSAAQTQRTDQGPALIVLSARSEDRLQEQVRQLREAIEADAAIHLADLAYTLQVGREAMEERLGLVVSSVEELKHKLSEHLEGRDVDELYRGQVKRNKETLAALTGDEDTAAMADAWIAKGKFGKLLDLWVKGMTVDWQRLYGNQKPQRISLPTYPFARERYWLDVSAPQAVQTATGGQLHPLLHRNTSSFEVQRFSSHFSGEEFFFADHGVKGTRILPGVAQLEMARHAVSLAMDEDCSLQLRDIAWLRPVVAGEDGVELYIALLPQAAGDIRFEIYSDGEGDESRVHCQGAVVTVAEAPGATVATHDLVALRAQCSAAHLDAAQCYAAFDRMGLAYGPSFQGLNELLVGDGQVLARVVLPASAPTEGYGLHPSLLDAALQATLGLLRSAGHADDGRLWLPATLGALELLAPCTANMWAVLRPSAGTAAVGALPSAIDVDLCDEHGVVCVRFSGLGLRIAAPIAEAGTALQTLLAKPVWEARPVAVDAAAGRSFARHVVMLCGLDAAATRQVQAELPDVTCVAIAVDEDLAASYASAAEVLLAQLQSLSRQPGQHRVQLLVPQLGTARLMAGLGGMLRTAQRENPALLGQVIQVEPGQNLSQALRDNRDSLAADVCYIGGERQVGGWTEWVGVADAASPWQDQGVYLITGGAGGLGLIFAQEIARRAKGARLVLTGRSPLNARTQASLDRLVAMGGAAQYRQLDVGDREAVTSLVAELVEAFGGLNGVLHSAGVLRDSFIIRKTREELQDVLHAKVAGTLNLDAATRDLALDCFICFSSIASALGNVGQADYAAANGFMEAFAHFRDGLVAQGLRQGRSLAINWPLWEEGGMQVDAATRRHLLQEIGMTPLRSASGCTALVQALGSGLPQVLVVEGHVERLKAALLTAAPAEPAVPQAETAPVQLGEDLRDKTVRHLVRLLSATLKLPPHKIDAQVALEAYGIDSVLVMDLTQKLEKSFGPLPKTLFFEYQTIAALSGYFLQSHHTQLVELLGEKPALSSPAVAPGLQREIVPTLRSRSRFGSRFDVRNAGPAVGEIAIIGLSGRYPEAGDVGAFWAN
ncbi:SDR family NAD(P)-dependent oxidoreductase, partial [Ideonella azotifigens]